MSETREVRAGKSAVFRPVSRGIGQRGVLVDNDTDQDVTVTVAVAGQVSELQAEVERLTAEREELRSKLSRERARSAALYVDGNRREERAMALLPDCDAHRRELQYLRHCVSWYWHAMNDSEEARHAIVGALGNTVLAITRGAAGPDGTVKAADLLTWLEQAIAKQDKPLKRHGYPSLADCLRSAHGDCDHDGVCGDVIAEVVEAFGLTLAEPPSKCKPPKAAR